MKPLRSGLVAIVAATALLTGILSGVAAADVPPVTVTNWTIQPMSTPSAATNAFAGWISCVSSHFCAAVGEQGPNASSTTLAETWDGSHWSVVPTPNVPGSASDVLESVSCVNASFCMAVGNSQTAGTNVTLAEQWNGSTWSLVTSPNPPASNDSYLDGISCTTTTFCVAVGVNATAILPLAEQWNGTSWTLQAISPPAGSANAQLTGVTCIGTSWCMTVGNSSSGAVEQTFASLWNGSSWASSSAQPVVGAAFAGFDGVACAGSHFCVAVGESSDGTNGSTLIETWNGASWSITASPNNGTQEINLLAGVDCTSPTSCAAVGRSGPTGNSESPFTEVWNGTAWTLLVPPAPAGPTGVGLNSVSCITDWACIAGGFATTGAIAQPYALTAGVARSGYRFVASDGGIFAYGPGAPFYGSMGGQHLNAPIVGMATMPAGDGYYFVASDGGVFNFGSAKFYGSMGGKPLNKPIVGMAVTADGAGYWLVASDGGIFNFGDAQFYGSTGALTLNKPVVGMTATPNGLGYYLVASDGGIFNYGNALFAGSMGGQPLNKPIVGMATPPAGGYYLVASDGGIFSFPVGAAGPPFFGSTGAIALNKPVIGMAIANGGSGYYLGASDGGIFSFPVGPAGPTFYGSRGGQPLNAPIVGMSG